MISFDFRPRTRILFGDGEFARLGEVAREVGGSKCLLVADQALVDRGLVKEAVRSLRARRMEVFAFHEFAETGHEARPTVEMVQAGADYAAPHDVNLVVAIGRGSTLDLAKAINIVLTNGGSIRNYRGYGLADRPLHPIIAVPNTAGAGAECLGYCTIHDPQEAEQTGSGSILVGDVRSVARSAILDPNLITGKQADLAAQGFDAIAHALETLLSTRRTAISECFSREAWRLLDTSLLRLLKYPNDHDARGAVLLGSHLAGTAVECSSLGPAHALAFPLTAAYGVEHGRALALVLGPAMQWSAESATSLGLADQEIEAYADRVKELARMAELPQTLKEAGIPESALPRLAEQAASQWTARFGVRPLDAASAADIYSRIAN